MLSRVKLSGGIRRPPERGSGAELFELGNQHRDARRWPEAVASYRRGLALAPDAFGIWVQLGHALKEAGDLPGAEAAYLHAQQMDPGDSDLQVQLGHFYSRAGQRAKGREHYERAVDGGSTDPIAVQSSNRRTIATELFSDGDACRDERRWAEAADFYKKGLAHDPAAFEIWVQLGHVLKEMGVPKQAEAAYLRALELRYSDGDLAVQLGHLYASMGDDARASDHYARAIGLGLRDHHALAFLSRQPAHYLSLKLALLRLNNDEMRRLEVLGSSDEGLSFAQFVLRYAR